MTTAKTILLATLLCTAFLGVVFATGISVKPRPKIANDTPVQAWWKDELQRMGEAHQNGAP